MYADMEELNAQFKKLGLKFDYDEIIMDHRIMFIQEELDELKSAVIYDEHAEALDALVDIVVVAIGTAIQMNWDFERAWKKVHKANMAKFAVKNKDINSRCMSYDLQKPHDWVAPNLEDCV